MRRTVLEVIAAISLTLAAMFTSASGVSASNVMVIESFARASATPMAKAGAAYVSLMNHGSEADRLVSAQSPAAETVEIHMTEAIDGVMKMRATGPLEIAPMGTLEMKPGGYHIMLMGLKAPLKTGEEIEITLTFEKAAALTLKVPVGEVAQGAHDHGMEESGGSAE